MAALNVLGLANLLEDGLVEMVLEDDRIGWRLTDAGRRVWGLLREGVIA